MVNGAAFAIHAQGYARPNDSFTEGRGGILGTLIGVDNLWFAHGTGSLKGQQTKAGIQTLGELPR